MKRYLLLAACSGICAAQSIDGFIVDSVTGQPVIGAHVAFGGATVNDHYMSFSDKGGHFQRMFPQAVSYDVVVSRAGYLTPERPLQIAPGQNSSNLQIQLTHQAAISGKLEDEDGFPMERARVEALPYDIANGQRKLRPAMARGTSNDLGEYRIAGLPAGSYYIRATPSDIRKWDKRYGPQYYPAGSTDALEGSAIQVAAGQEQSGVAFTMKKHEGVSVAGRIVLPTGTEVTPAMRSLFLQSTDGTGFTAGSIVWQPDQPSFIFRHVPPGTYAVTASSVGARTPKPGDLILRQEVQVGGTDLTDVVAAFHAADASGK